MDAKVDSPKTAVNVERKAKSYFWLRAALACAAIGLMLAVHFAPAAFGEVKPALRSVFCYDIFGRTDFGDMPIFSSSDGE